MLHVDILMINRPPFYALLSVVFEIPDMAFIFHFHLYMKNLANNIIKLKISSDLKSFALPNSTKSSFSFIFVILLHFSFTIV